MKKLIITFALLIVSVGVSYAQVGGVFNYTEINPPEGDQALYVADTSGTARNLHIRFTTLEAWIQTLDLNASNLTSGTVPLARLSGITTSQLDASAGIVNAQLANSAVNYGGVSLSLGGTDLTPAFDLQDATGLAIAGIDATGTADGTTFLRGDGQWATPAGSGDVTGPGSATDNAVTRFDGTSGTQIQNSGVTIDDSNNLDVPGALTLGTALAVAEGGTGSTTASNARTALGVAIGSDVQAWDTDLDTWATKTAPTGAVVGISDTQTLTNKTLTQPTLTLKQSAGAAPTAQGDLQYDTTDDCLVVGDGSNTTAFCGSTDINTQTGTSYTLVLSDNNSLVRTTSSSAVTITVPANSTTAFPVGAAIWIKQSGTGGVTVSGAGGVTVNGTTSISTQYDDLTLVKIATDTWETSDDANSGGGSGSMTTVKEDDTQVGDADIVTLDFGSGLDVTESPDTEVQIVVDEAEVDHDQLLNFVADEHIAHTGVTLTAGVGLTGGGDISANRTFDLDVNGLTAEATVDGAADYLVLWDASASAHRKVLPDDLPSGGGGSPGGATGDVQYNDGASGFTGNGGFNYNEADSLLTIHGDGSEALAIKRATGATVFEVITGGNNLVQLENPDAVSTLGINVNGVPGSATVKFTPQYTEILTRDLRIGNTAKLYTRPTTLTIADGGADGGAKASGTLEPHNSHRIDCQDDDGCTITISESGAVDGHLSRVTVISSTTGTVDFSDTAGVSELNGPLTLNQWDVLTLEYISDRWVQSTPISDN